jgi:SAM-dependent methyltransferase
MTPTLEDTTVAAFEPFAPFYEQYTHDYEYGPWMSNVEAVALSHGLRGNRLLDVGCGTGKSFMPMLARGYEVTACDISPAMVERAREIAAGTGAAVTVADVRHLAVLGRFDLATSMDDALNYLLTDDELELAFEGVARNLRPGGLFVFDLNTLGGYRRHFPSDSAREVDGAFFCWRGETPAGPIGPGSTFSSVIEVFATDDGDSWRRVSSRHVQRHHPPELVERLLSAAGFELVDCRGQVTGGVLEPVADEDLYVKLDYFARRLPSDASRGRTEWR